MLNVIRKYFFTFVGGVVGTAVGLEGKSAHVQTPAPIPEKAVLRALCLVCRKSVSVRRGTVRRKLGRIETQPSFDSIGLDPDKPFGAALPATGNGSSAGGDTLQKRKHQSFLRPSGKGS
jgi:hypothetical protein